MHNLLFDFINKYITLTNEEKETLISLDLFHSVKKGTTLLNVGEKSSMGYFVLKGCLRTHIYNRR